MAEVRRRLGRGAHDFALQIRNRCFLQGRSRYGRSALRCSSLSAGFLLGDIKKCDRCGRDQAAGRVTGGAAQDAYTTPLFAAPNNVWGNGNIYNGLNNELSLSVKALSVAKAPLLCGGAADFQRTLLGSGSGTLFWGRSASVRAYSGNGDRSEPLYRSKTGYYDILEVTPTATWAQIKTAYYKQSFAYHPDRNAGSDEATLRFSEINEAYTVLGNKALRKKYDRGLLSLADLTATSRPSAKDSSGGSGRAQGDARRPAMDAHRRERVSDFDEFFKSYYNEQLQRQQDLRARREHIQKRKERQIGEKDPVNMLWVGISVMVGMILMFSASRR